MLALILNNGKMRIERIWLVKNNKDAYTRAIIYLKMSITALVGYFAITWHVYKYFYLYTCFYLFTNRHSITIIDVVQDSSKLEGT